MIPVYTKGYQPRLGCLAELSTTQTAVPGKHEPYRCSVQFCQDPATNPGMGTLQPGSLIMQMAAQHGGSPTQSAHATPLACTPGNGQARPAPRRRRCGRA